MSRTHRPRTEFQILLSMVALGSFLSIPCCAQTTPNPSLEAQPLVSVSENANSGATSLPDLPQVQPVSNSETEGDTDSTGHPVRYVFPSLPERKKDFLIDFLGPGAFIDPALQAAFDQAHSLKVGYPPDGYPGSGAHPGHGEVPEWSEGFDGYSKRYASRFGMGLIGTTSRYGIGELLHQDISYHLCQCTGVLPRAYHAVTQSLLAHTHSGRAVPSLSALVSPYIAAEIATAAWYPARYNGSDALRTSTPLYFGLPIKNLINEFKRH